MPVDYGQLASLGVGPAELAAAFRREYFADRPETFPVNPFQMLRDEGVWFSFRPFGGYEGVYIPASDKEDGAVVGINLDRQITRQRYTAAHELCHHLKDRGEAPTLCPSEPRSRIERYAEAFAAELLMPREELLAQVARFKRGGYVDFDGVLMIAHHFGVSFQACLIQLAYRLKVIEGDISSISLNMRRDAFRPNKRKRELGLWDTVLYEQLFDAADECLNVDITPRMRQRFETEFVFHDSRMEGVDVSPELAAEIVVDLRLNKQESRFCSEGNKDIVEVAGLTLAYDYVFGKGVASDPVSIYDAKTINSFLFSTAVFPEFGGRYRTANSMVLGGGFETADYRMIPQGMMALGDEIEALCGEPHRLAPSEYIERVLRLHHRITVIHPFSDGNGRTSRAFANLLFLRRGLPPVLFDAKDKDVYKGALAEADATGRYDALYEIYFKQMLRSHSILTDVA